MSPDDVKAGIAERMRRTQQSIFAVLIDQHSGMLLAYLRSLLNRSHDVEELYQETVLAAWKGFSRYDRERPFAPWLRTIGRNCVYSFFASRQRRTMHYCCEETIEALEAELVHVESRPGDTWDEKVIAVRECIAHLTEHHRRSIELHYDERCGVDELARRLGVSVEAAKKRLQRGREKVAECLRTKAVFRRMEGLAHDG